MDRFCWEAVVVFLAGAVVSAGMFGLGVNGRSVEAAGVKSADPKPVMDANLLVIGPRPGYTPDIGTMVSMLTYIQTAVVGPVKGMTQADLDFLFDKDSNSIGALLLHLAATETYYQMNTFDNKKWDSWGDGCEEEVGTRR